MTVKKFNPRVWMGICSAVGYLIILAVKARQFGWEDIPEYWLWSGVGLVLVMAGVTLVHSARGRRAERAEMDRLQARANFRRRADNAPVEPPPGGPGS